MSLYFLRSLDPQATKSVDRVSSKDATGKEYTHTIEPEIASATIPRVAHFKIGTVSLRRGIWNVALVLTGLALYLSSNSEFAPYRFVISLAVFVLFWAVIALNDRRLHHERHLLREGVAVHGLVYSGEVIDVMNPPLYQIRYSYWVGDGKRKGRANVSEAEYKRFTRGNPYFTVLYDATNPSTSKPYFQIADAELVGK